ncbi:MAG: signal peptide peptidase SppA [Nitrospirae bacterium]|nr:MAG: signal peptide peptidase SppA [Nitrospirota bacterium]
MKIRLLLPAAIALVTAGCISISLFPQPGPLHEKTVQGTAADKILMIDVSGIIAEKPGSGGGFGPSEDIVARVKEELTMAAEDAQIKALLLRINSPGGTVTASDVLHHELSAFKARRKMPVVAVIMDVGASGGYYVASAADRIVAHPTSVTGSVGVIMLRVNAEGLLQKIGVEAGAIKSGSKKDIGSPFRPMSEEEREIFQAMINGFQTRFLEVVTKSRSGLTPDRLKLIADGRVFTGPQAVQLGLADQTGYLDDGIAAAKQLAGVADARVVIYARPGAYKHNIYSESSGPGTLEALARLDVMGLVRGGTPQFLYLWMP